MARKLSQRERQAAARKPSKVSHEYRLFSRKAEQERMVWKIAIAEGERLKTWYEWLNRWKSVFNDHPIITAVTCFYFILAVVLGVLAYIVG